MTSTDLDIPRSLPVPPPSTRPSLVFSRAGVTPEKIRFCSLLFLVAALPP